MDGLLVVDMQEKFLGPRVGRVPGLIKNTCEQVNKAISEGKKIFCVTFNGYGNLIPELSSILPSNAICFQKDNGYFPIVERKGKDAGLYYGYLEGINTMGIAGVNTAFCVRQAYRTLFDEGITPSLILGSTLDLGYQRSSLSFIRSEYISYSGIEPEFSGYEPGMNSLEDYL